MTSAGSLRWGASLVAAPIVALTLSVHANQTPRGYQDLLALFAEFAAFEKPAMREGAPDYTSQATARRGATLKTRVRSACSRCLW